MQMMLDRGTAMKPFVIEGWYDCGKPETLLQTNRALLTKNGSHVPEEAYPTAKFLDPVSVGEGAVVENSIIGPNVTVAEGAVIKNSIITNSVISNNAHVENLILDSSIIANDASITGSASRLNIGDHSELTLS